MFSSKKEQFFIVSASLVFVACISPHPSGQISHIEKDHPASEVVLKSSQKQVGANQAEASSAQNQAELSTLKSTLGQSVTQEQTLEVSTWNTQISSETSEKRLQQTEKTNRNDKSNTSNVKRDAPKESVASPAPSAVQSGKATSPTAGTLSESLSDTIVEGGLSKRTFGRVLQTNRERILTCYNKELRINGDAQGLVLTKIDITNTGQVAAVSVLQSDLGDLTFEKCIVAAIKRLKFPTPRGGREVRVSHPFRFSPGS